MICPPSPTTIVGIVNITTDSFSDGGLYLAADAAIRHAFELRNDGADIIELGAESSNPDATEVPAEVEIKRLRPVLAELTAADISVSIDSRKPEVQCVMAAEGAQMINDITGFPDPVPSFLSASTCRLVLIHSVQRGRRADTRMADPGTLMETIVRFFTERTAALETAGVERTRIVLDPGMGFFLGANPDASLTVLRGLAGLREQFGLPVMISVSRKSFLRTLTGRSIERVGAATLAAELFAAASGAEYVRTHDAGALRDGLEIVRALTTPEGTPALGR